jgi:hypothetical protein
MSYQFTIGNTLWTKFVLFFIVIRILTSQTNSSGVNNYYNVLLIRLINLLSCYLNVATVHEKRQRKNQKLKHHLHKLFLNNLDFIESFFVGFGWLVSYKSRYELWGIVSIHFLPLTHFILCMGYNLICDQWRIEKMCPLKRLTQLLRRITQIYNQNYNFGQILLPCKVQSCKWSCCGVSQVHSTPLQA